MEAAEKIAMFKVLVDDSTVADATVSVYLSLAADKIIKRAFPFDDTVTAVPAKYEVLQCRVAAAMWDKRGADGETAHNENGINRSYESGDVAESLMREIIPSCGVFMPRVEATVEEEDADA